MHTTWSSPGGGFIEMETADEIATFQMGTHPLLTASPVAYQVVNAAELALAKRP